jgi:hypothetical protein
MHVSIKALVPHGSLATAVLEFNSQRRYASAMPDDLYERDVLAWSEHQAALLRRAAGGERVNDIDWMHVVEEIEDVGLSELNAVQSYLRQILVHLLKLQAWPTLAACRHWRSEIVAFQTDAQHRFAPSMLRYGGKAPSPAPATCPVTLDALLTAPCAALEAAFATEKSAGTTQAPR